LTERYNRKFNYEYVSLTGFSARQAIHHFQSISIDMVDRVERIRPTWRLTDLYQIVSSKPCVQRMPKVVKQMMEVDEFFWYDIEAAYPSALFFLNEFKTPDPYLFFKRKYGMDKSSVLAYIRSKRNGISELPNDVYLVGDKTYDRLHAAMVVSNLAMCAAVIHCKKPIRAVAADAILCSEVPSSFLKFRRRFLEDTNGRQEEETV